MKGFDFLGNSNLNYPWAQDRQEEEWGLDQVVLSWEELGGFSMVEHKMVNWTHETVDAGWESAISVCSPCSETVIGFAEQCLELCQASSRAGLCHQHRSECTAFMGCHPKAATCKACWAPLHPLHWHICLLCLGRSDSPTAAWMVLVLLENQRLFFPSSFPVLSQMRCQHPPLPIAGRVHVTADAQVFSEWDEMTKVPYQGQKRERDRKRPVLVSVRHCED